MKHRCKDVKLEWFCVWIGLVALFSCESNQLGTDYVGKLRLSLIADTTSLSKGVNGVTKAVNAGEFDAFLTTSDYRICILQEADTMHIYERFDEMPAEVELKEGAYTLIAEKGNNLPAAFENPYFAGSVDFSIRADMSTPIDVTCTLANARITVEYTDDFKEAYSDYTVLLSSAFTSGDLEIAKGETRPAYVQVAKEGSELGVAIRLKKVNEEEEKTYHVPTPLSIERRQNIRLIFKTDGAALEGIGLEVLLDDELTELTLNEGIPDFMWKPFEKPTLSPDGFQDMEELTINDGDLEKELSVGFVMPAGISSLCIKQWREDKEEDVITYDLATDEGVAAALDSYFKWTVNNRLNRNVKEERKAGQLFLKDAINSLAPPVEEGQTYTYHWEFSGVDATGKGHETNTLHLTIVVQPAGMPIITVDGFSAPVIVEGDAMSKGAEVHYKAGSGIDETKTSLVVNKGEESETYQLFDNSHRTSLKELGIDVQASDATTLTIQFRKDFSTYLEAPEEGEVTYTYLFHLVDKEGRSFETEEQLVVKAPVFELKTTEGDAFAKRIVLRADMPIGHKEQLAFQYKGTGETTWQDMETHAKQDGTVYVDTLKGLEPLTEYQVRAIYGSNGRVSESVSLKTEEDIPLENGDFEADWTSRTISGMLNGATPLTDVSLTSDDPYGWSTVNTKTFSGEKVIFDVLSTYNSVPSTMKVEGSSGNGVRLRTVGWDNEWGNTKDICYHIAAGKIFLGSYSYNHDNNTDTYNYGMSFVSRPSSVKAHYKYTPVNRDSFKAWIVVLNKENGVETEIGRGELINNNSLSDWTELTFPIYYTDVTKKATHMYIVFSSSADCSENESIETENLKNFIEMAVETDGYTHHEGSNLYIDNIQLIYE